MCHHFHQKTNAFFSTFHQKLRHQTLLEEAKNKLLDDTNKMKIVFLMRVFWLTSISFANLVTVIVAFWISSLLDFAWCSPEGKRHSKKFSIGGHHHHAERSFYCLKDPIRNHAWRKPIVWSIYTGLWWSFSWCRSNPCNLISHWHDSYM